MVSAKPGFFFVYIRPVLSSSRALGLTAQSLHQCCRAQCSRAMNRVPHAEHGPVPAGYSGQQGQGALYGRPTHIQAGPCSRPLVMGRTSVGTELRLHPFSLVPSDSSYGHVLPAWRSSLRAVARKSLGKRKRKDSRFEATVGTVGFILRRTVGSVRWNRSCLNILGEQPRHHSSCGHPPGQCQSSPAAANGGEGTCQARQNGLARPALAGPVRWCNAISMTPAQRGSIGKGEKQPWELRRTA